MIPGLQRVELHCYLHGVTDPKRPHGGMDGERAATETRRHIRTSVADLGTRSPLQSGSLQLTGASKEQTNHRQEKKNRTYRIRNRAADSLLKRSSPQKIQQYFYTIRWYFYTILYQPRLPHILQPVLCSEVQESNCFTIGEGFLRSREMVRAICRYNLTLISSGICLFLLYL